MQITAFAVPRDPRRRGRHLLDLGDGEQPIGITTIPDTAPAPPPSPSTRPPPALQYQVGMYSGVAQLDDLRNGDYPDIKLPSVADYLTEAAPSLVALAAGE